MSEETGQTLYEIIGGEVPVKALVDRFYDLMEEEASFEVIRRLHPPDLTQSKEKLFKFFSGWMGGPNLYIQEFGHPMLRARHLPFAIGIPERDAWLACMRQALIDTQVEPTLQQVLLEYFFWHRRLDAKPVSLEYEKKRCGLLCRNPSTGF